MVTKRDAIKDAVQKASKMREVLRTFVSENGVDASAFDNDMEALEKTATAMFNEAEGNAAFDFVTGNARARQALRLVTCTGVDSDTGALYDMKSSIEDEMRRVKFDYDEQGKERDKIGLFQDWVAQRMFFAFEDISLLDREVLIGILIGHDDYLAFSLKGVPDEIRQVMLNNLTDKQKLYLIEDIEFMGSVTWGAVVKARWNLLSLIDSLLAKGIMRLPKNGVAPSIEQKPLPSCYLCNASMDEAVKLRRAIRSLILSKAKGCKEDVEELLGTYGTDADKDEAQKIEAKAFDIAARDFCFYAVCGVTSIYESVTDERGKFRKALHPVPHAAMQSFVASLTDDDECLRRAIKAAVVFFNDVLLLDDRSVQKMMRETDTEVLAKALQDANEDVRNKMYRNMSKRASVELKKCMERVRPFVSRNEIASCQSQILDMIVRLADAGEIAIRYGEDLYD